VNIPVCGLQEVSRSPNMAQSNKHHAEMFAYGNQIIVPKLCEYIKSGHNLMGVAL
jgi:hypothetical protein